jgi:hypothetical protein
MAMAIIFILGIGNFALHKAVLESGHPMLRVSSRFARVLSGRITLLTEFCVLLAALLLAANGWPGLAWAYLGYSALNAGAAWLILTHRV